MNNVLIIEDETNTAEAVKEALEINNVHADVAENGEQGVSRFQEGNYDLILLDLKMPKMDGEAVLQEIRKEDPFVDVIVYTNYQDFADIKKLTNIGIQGYINKGPKANLEELTNMILEKLAPIDEAELETMVKHTPTEMFEGK